MTWCSTPPSLPLVKPEHGVERLVPAVTDLLRRVSGNEPVIRGGPGSDIRLSASVSFSDGVGRGEVIAQMFMYRGSPRVDIHLDHNRVFAAPGGAPSSKHCYLNDYKASVGLADGAETLPPEFVRSVVAGLSAARDAVRRHNHRWQSPWFTVQVTTE
jgi:hypothetical protein